MRKGRQGRSRPVQRKWAINATVAIGLPIIYCPLPSLSSNLLLQTMSLSAWTQSNSSSLDLWSSSRRLVRSKSGLRVVAINSREEPPWTLQEPQWLQDSQVRDCPGCQQRFDLLRRKHHCRRCGLIFCGSCASTRVSLHRMNFIDPVRHCRVCARVTAEEKLFFETRLKLLFRGAAMFVAHLDKSCHVRLSGDVRFVVIDIDANLGLVELGRIRNIEVDENHDKMVIESNCNAEIKNKEGNLISNNDYRIEFVAQDSNEAREWLLAFQQAMNMVLDKEHL